MYDRDLQSATQMQADAVTQGSDPGTPQEALSLLARHGAQGPLGQLVRVSETRGGDPTGNGKDGSLPIPSKAVQHAGSHGQSPANSSIAGSERIDASASPDDSWKCHLMSGISSYNNSKIETDGLVGLSSHNPASSTGPCAPASGLRTVALGLEELSALPPATAAALYRSMELVLGGVQELREGRPLSRGGTGSGIPRPPPCGNARPASSSQGHRPCTPYGSSCSAEGRTSILSHRASSSGAGRPPSASGHALGQAYGSQAESLQPQEATGAMALLISSGMPSAHRAMPSGQRSMLSNSGLATPAALMSSAEDCGESGFLEPITFPLASGVRSMLRKVSMRQGGGPGEVSPLQARTGLAMIKNPAMSARSEDGEASNTGIRSDRSSSEGMASQREVGPQMCTGMLKGDIPTVFGVSTGAGTYSVCGTSATDEVDVGNIDKKLRSTACTLAGPEDELDTVRQVLARLSPHLLDALDEHVLWAGEEHETEQV